ncbi:MAG: cell division protein FtsQ [Prevotella sp.]|nr:cell division protein FtsQ [Prevotella sp.]
MHINWKKTIIVTLDLMLGAYIITAFAAFDKPNVVSKVCTQVDINIKDEATNGFITASEIKNRLERNKLYPLSKLMHFVNTRIIEETLEQSPFVKKAECYKTEDGHVNITLTQRMPTLRIKSINGDDYYIDDNHSIMPNSHYTSDLIIATGHINKWFARTYVSLLAESLMGSDFWRNQIVQIHVLSDHGIELVPRVGNHIVYIGQLPESNFIGQRKKLIADFMAKKMNRLEKFYKYGLSQAGWNKYSYINIEFDNQIICKKTTVN